MQYFRAVCQNGSVTRAAEELFVSRPAVSRLLSELERELGVMLFSRSSSGISLTEAGAVFNENCLEILNRIETLEKRMLEMSEKDDGYLIKIGLTPATGIIIFPKLYRKLFMDYPDIKLKVVEDGNIKLKQMLLDGEIDIMFTSDVEWESKLCGSWHLFDTELVFCTSKDNPLAENSFVTIKDIETEPLIYMEKYMQREAEVSGLFASYGLEPQIVMRTAQISLIRRFVTDSSVSAIQIKSAIDDGSDIIGIPFSPPIPIKIGIKWNLASEKNKKLNTILDYIKKFNFEV